MVVSVVVAVMALHPARAEAAGVFRQDAKALVSVDNLVLLSAGMALAGAGRAWDDDGRRLQDIALLEATEVTNLYGSSTFNLPASFLAWAVGRASHQKELAGAGSAALRGLLYVQAVVGPLKLAVRRERPDGSNRKSFPSGHAANTVALAELFRRRYGCKVGVPLYALAALTALGRLEENVHYASDVLAGAAIGFVIGRSVDRLAGSPVQVGSATGGVGVVVSF